MSSLGLGPGFCYICHVCAQLAPVEMYVVSLVGGGFHLRCADTDVGVPTCK